MKIDYQDKGSTAVIIIASFITERRLHNRCVDAALLATPVRASSVGFFCRLLFQDNHYHRQNDTCDTCLQNHL